MSERERTLAALLRELDGRASPALLRSSLERAYDAGAAGTAYELGKQTGPVLAEILTERGELRAQAQQDGARIAELDRLRADLETVKQVLRKVPVLRLAADALGWECVGCGAVSGITPTGEDVEQESTFERITERPTRCWSVSKPTPRPRARAPSAPPSSPWRRS
jgi:hypothetical protein